MNLVQVSKKIAKSACMKDAKGDSERKQAAYPHTQCAMLRRLSKFWRVWHAVGYMLPCLGSGKMADDMN